MSKRLIIVLGLILLPQVAPVTSRAAEAPAAGLGPAAGTTGTGSSSADSSALQPAGNTPIQSSNTASTGLTAPATNTLQAPATSDENLRVIMSDSDGGSYELAPEDSGINWGWLWWTLVLGALVGGASIVLRDRRRFRDH